MPNIPVRKKIERAFKISLTPLDPLSCPVSSGRVILKEPRQATKTWPGMAISEQENARFRGSHSAVDEIVRCKVCGLKGGRGAADALVY
eukprot:g66000.t1